MTLPSSVNPCLKLVLWAAFAFSVASVSAASFAIPITSSSGVTAFALKPAFENLSAPCSVKTPGANFFCTSLGVLILVKCQPPSEIKFTLEYFFLEKI